MLLCKNYAMPVKTMIYDAMNYGDQVNEAKKHHQKNKDYKSSDEEKLIPLDNYKTTKPVSPCG